MRLEHVVMLAAPPSVVWDALVDVDGWHRWNPTLADAQAPLVAGTTVRMRLRLGPLRVPMRQQVTAVDPPRRLAWTSINGVPGAMDVDREFLLEPTSEGTRFTQAETARGPLTPVLMPLLRRRILAGYVGIADGLAGLLDDPEGATTEP